MTNGISLSPQQTEVLIGISTGLTAKEMASQSGVSMKSIDSHRYRLMQRLGLHNRIELTRYAIKNRIVSVRGFPNTLAPAELTDRQREVVALTADGLSVKEIADLLDLSDRSIDAHKHRAMHRLNIHDSVLLVHYCVCHQLTPVSKPGSKPLMPNPHGQEQHFDNGQSFEAE